MWMYHILPNENLIPYVYFSNVEELKGEENERGSLFTSSWVRTGSHSNKLYQGPHSRVIVTSWTKVFLSHSGSAMRLNHLETDTWLSSCLIETEVPLGIALLFKIWFGKQLEAKVMSDNVNPSGS